MPPSNINKNIRYWLVACSTSDVNRESVCKQLRERTVIKTNLCEDVCIFETPLDLKYGSIDDLIRNVDDLIKNDNFIENVLRRIEKQVIEIDPNTELKIFWQRNSMTVDQCIRRFTWDDAKYSRNRSMRDTIEQILSAVTKLDEEVRIKTSSWHEAKTQTASIAKKENTSLAQRDLNDVLTPEVVQDGDFVNTEHLTTLVVCIPRGMEKDWLGCYENLEKFVVPRSTKKFDVSDKDGNTLWKVVLFKSAVEPFKNSAKAKRFIARDFLYSEEAYRSTTNHRTKLEAEKTRQETFLGRICCAAFSDCFVAWLHVKAMRVFCEAVLRFGLPVRFAAFALILSNENVSKKLRKEVEAICAPTNAFAKHFMECNTGDAILTELTNSNEDFYPYVSLSFTPFSEINKQTD